MGGKLSSGDHMVNQLSMNLRGRKVLQESVSLKTELLNKVK